MEIAALDLWTAELAADHGWGSGLAPRGSSWGGGGLRLFRLGLAASHHHLSASGLEAPADVWLCKALVVAGWAALAAPSPSRHPPTGALRLGRAAPAGRPPAGPWAPSEGALAAWAAALLAPSGGALAAWGVWLAPLYLGAGLGGLAASFGWPSPAAPRGAAGASHSPLAPLAHTLGGGLSWGLASPTHRPTLGPYAKPTGLLPHLVPLTVPVLRRNRLKLVCLTPLAAHSPRITKVRGQYFCPVL